MPLSWIIIAFVLGTIFIYLMIRDSEDYEDRMNRLNNKKKPKFKLKKGQEVIFGEDNPFEER